MENIENIKTKKAKRLIKQIEKHQKYMEFFKYCIKNLEKLNPVIIDIETTGVMREDEILQVTMIDLNGKILLNKYVKPRRIQQWDRAYKIHGISPEDVENKKSITFYRREIEKILKKHRLVIGYEVLSDINFLKKAKIDVNGNQVLDIGYLFTNLFQNVNKTETRMTPSLTNAANYYNYQFEAHNGLTDCLATLHCFNNLLKEDEENFEFNYDESILDCEYEEKKEIKKDKLFNLANEYIEIYEKMENKIILDLETTGIREDDEIIQLSIIDLEGNKLFDNHIKPTYVTEWDEAYKIHKISKEDLEDKFDIQYHRENIQKILDDTDCMVGYGIKFDYELLKRHNFNVDHIQIIDISEYFKYLYRKILGDLKAKRPKLIECASYYGFKSNNYHDSLTDCNATLLSYKGIYKDMKEVVDAS